MTTRTAKTIGFYTIHESPGGETLAELSLPEQQYLRYLREVSQPCGVTILQAFLGRDLDMLASKPPGTQVYLEPSVGAGNPEPSPAVHLAINGEMGNGMYRIDNLAELTEDVGGYNFLAHPWAIARDYETAKLIVAAFRERQG